MAQSYSFDTLRVNQPSEFVFHVQLNRPQKRNAVNRQLRRDLKSCFDQLATDPNCRAVVISGAGKMFTSGIDLADLNVLPDRNLDAARMGLRLHQNIKDFQDVFTAMEKCPKPIIAAVHGACVGAGIDLISSCDIRLCSKDTYFSVKEVDVGLAADVGTLQRLPKIIGNNSIVRELAFTARNFSSDEAKDIGLVSNVHADNNTVLQAALKMASLIAAKSPIAVLSSKVSLNYSRDHTVDEGLEHIAAWNMCMLQSEDMGKIFKSFQTKARPVFSKL
ncbi:Delta(3,5)-Delta(2,4)-dienoyl-CoA isomerase, mitochondrial [Trichoplax sp. H2]|nr:Delta(3,5)-Delta(2,4)-dienoyl-CoA isomerase, mitochondrial [Trichoplax sp. H2]|eukprot:RDD41192.1 Delta(3,5)-Delta(2,4)-dienoyl-CoA isomerase, mitochondrial [Trichoplax sp. H2]